MNFIQSLLLAIEHFDMIGYWIAFLAALLETIIGIGLIIPGSTIILFMGALSAKGYFDLGDLIWFVAIGVIIGRFIPSVKEIIPFIAGSFGMKQSSFIIWNILGSIGWALLFVLPGFFFAQSLDIAKIWLTRTGFFLILLLIIFALFYILKNILIKKGKAFFSFFFSIWKSIKYAIAENPEVKDFVNRHKKVFAFLQKRLNKNDFYGLPLTFSFLSLLYVFALFAGIIEDILNSESIISIDIRVAHLLDIFRSTELTTVFSWITFLGNWQTIVIFATATILLLWIWKKKSYITPLLLSIAGSTVFTAIGKILFHRSRPDVALYTENSFSFPSGHATIAIAFYGFVAYLLIRNSKKWRYKINIFFVSFIVIFLIGFSRLYLGVHYLSDVWGGYLVGAMWGIIAISLAEYFLSKKQKDTILLSNRKKQIASVGIIGISIVLYIIFALEYQIPPSIQMKKTNKIAIEHIMDIFRSDQMKYTETLSGNKQEPISFIIIAQNDQRLTEIFQNAGWILADDLNGMSLYKATKASILKQSYPQAPITPNFWNSEVHNFGFEKETATENIRTRHHARFWKTNSKTQDGKNIYVGSASFDQGLKWYAWGVTHIINPDIDAERKFLFTDLKNTGLISKDKKQEFVTPQLGNNFTGDVFFTDGKVYILFVKK